MKKWTAVQFTNLERKIQERVTAKGYQLKRVQLPQNINIQLEVELDDEVFKKVSANPTFVQRIQNKALELTNKALDEVTTLVMTQDGKASMMNAQVAATFSRDLTEATNMKLKAAGQQMATETDRMFEDLKRTQVDLKKFRIKSGFKIGLSVIGIGASIGVAIGTAGAISPLSGLGIARSGVTIAQEVGKLFSNCDQIDKLIKVDMAVLKKIMVEKPTTTGQKVGQGFKEVGLNALSRVTGVETTSFANLEKRIDLLHANVGKLDKESAKLSEKVYGVMDANKALETMVKNAVATLPATKVGSIKMKLQSAEHELDKMLKNIVKVNESINNANTNHPKYKKALEDMRNGIPGWINKVDAAISMALDLGTGAADASTAIERGLGSMVTIITGVADEFGIDQTARLA